MLPLFVTPPAQGGTAEITPATAKAVLRDVRAAGTPAVLVNVWATWCIPCREEFPELLRLRADYRDRGLTVILVSGDFDSALSQVREFLTEQRVDFRTYIKTGADMEFINAFDPQWSGALPATFVFDRRGVLQRSFLRKANYAELEQAVGEILAAAKVSKGDQ